MNNKFLKMTTLLLCSMVGVGFVSCGSETQTQTDDGGEAYKSETYMLVEKHIYSMADKPWDKGEYSEIKNNQIPTLKRESERSSLYTLLEAEYAKLLVRDAKKILQDGCPEGAASHNLLKKMMDELKPYENKKVPEFDVVKKLKEFHDSVKSFAKVNMQNADIDFNYRTEYDIKYEREKINKAKNYLNNPDLKCKQLREKLEKLSTVSGYSDRRKDYCEKVVASYLQCTKPERSELNAAKANLNVYNGDTSDWKSLMDEHFNQLNENEE